MDLEKLTERIEALDKRTQEAIDSLREGNLDEEGQKAISKQLEDLQAEVEPLRQEREARVAEEERKALIDGFEDLQKQFQAERHKTESPFGIPTPVETDTKAMQFYGDRNHPAAHSYWKDQLLSREGDREAQKRLSEVEDEAHQLMAEGKAMTQSVSGAAGGYLVADQIAAEILQLKVQLAVVEQLFSKLQVDSDTLRISSVTGGLTSGWTAELASKPTQDMTFGEITAGVFTVAGLAYASRQLVRNSRASIDRLVNADLAKRINTVKEVAYINGTGTGQPRGILNTTGVNSVVVATAGAGNVNILDGITDAITAIYTNFLEGPNAIVMHPRTWAALVKSRESASPTSYLVNQPGQDLRRYADNIPGYGGGQTPRGVLFGYPVYTTANIPTNLGAGTNESRILVGKFDEGLKLENAALRFDQSDHVGFVTNQVVFRAEEDLGFTAERYPKAFSVVSGAGLAGI